ncbi:5,10-methenyltetrahydromethanopterin hydrogenase cofactor biosynthesis protein HmdC [Desulfurobacterium atlanticum]|uniref:5,10-methenyltetrahydromethanopterin hydrogenase cofactor biosynthesis protein HmdC n=1 Tax=Desulfurobacterium atlanticum TaxID=240169 RepID=A0A239A4F8_9BACT|nr:5,10-methenyltetrahydromethanopterin hydrogenase cofactor biosynthesis protein HmdC [Desulfurobacterium atlanticum]SNR90312.1 5,10-methenyltetrahydromethanopterin hydrogenase cofactor biosynthesis protein HmdC [Desulfurobacterium atlanticum]
MRELIDRVLDGDCSAILNLETEGKQNLNELKENIEMLTDQELSKLGQIYKSFPFGCDLNEILVDVISSKQSLAEIKGSFRLVDRLGFPVHVCSYAIADIAEKLEKTPFALMEELRKLTDMPIDVDHFGKYGPMRYPEEIVNCPADCYRTGKPFNGCPRGRIHKRLIEKEKANEEEMEKWFSICQSISVSFMSFQKNTSHAAPPDETLYVIEKARSSGKGVGAIICVGDGKDELIKGLKACIDYEIDEIVIEGGPYNCAKNRVRAFGEAVVMARIVSKGKIVATNGQYEDELRFGLKCGLNSVISGFPGNHHAYMSGYMPYEATVEKFGLPKVMEIMAEEIEDSPFPVPADRTVSEVIVKSANFLGKENIYPLKKIGGVFVGDAHWFLLLNSPLGEKNKPEMTVDELADRIKDKKIKSLGIIGGRFISWVIAEKVARFVDSIYISDKNQDVEKFTVEHLKKLFSVKIERCYGDDKLCVNRSQLTVLASFIPSLIKKFRKLEGVLTLED